MEVSPNALRKETVEVYRQVNVDLELNRKPEVRATLLLAKAQCLNTLTLLSDKGRKQ